MKSKRGVVAFNALILLLFLGLVYAWSVFKKPLALQFGWDDGQLTWTFTICMSCFCLGGFAGARLATRFSPSSLVRAGAVIIAAGFACTAFISQLWQMYLAYGVVIGGAIGIVYNVVLATVNRWFPDRPGFISGLLLMAFGTGSLVFGPLATTALERMGWRTTMLLLGGLFLIVFVLTSFSIRPPGEQESVRTASANTGKNAAIDLAPRRMLCRKDFWVYLLWCVLMCSTGLALVGQASTIAMGFSLPDLTAAWLVGMVSICNGLGRVIFGALYDRSGRTVTMLLITACQLAGSVMLMGAVRYLSVPLMVAAFAAISLGYGGAIPTNANFVRSYFGNAHYATNFSIVNFNILISVSIGQYIGSGLSTATGGYFAMACAMLVISVMALAGSFLIGPQPRLDRLEAGDASRS